MAKVSKLPTGVLPFWPWVATIMSQFQVIMLTRSWVDPIEGVKISDKIREGTAICWHTNPRFNSLPGAAAGDSLNVVKISDADRKWGHEIRQLMEGNDHGLGSPKIA